jgi:hypothetical protein
MDIWIHIVYLVAIYVVITFMRPECIGRKPCLELFYSEHGYAYLVDDTYIFFYVFLHLSTKSSIPTPSHTYFCKVP